MRQLCFGSTQNKGNKVFAPRFIFSGLWLSQIFLHLVFNDAFVPFEFLTWVVIVLGLIFFNFGAATSERTYLPYVSEKILDLKTSEYEITHFFNAFVVIYIVCGVLTAIELYGALQELGAGGFNLPKIRELVIQDFTGERVLYNQFRVFYVGVGFSIFFIALSSQLTGRQIVAALTIGIVSALLTTGRLYLLLYFLSVTALLYRAKYVTARGVLIAAFVFILLFFMVAVLLGKGEDDGVISVFDSVLWNSQVYLMSSVSCFNDFLATGSQTMEGGALLPNPAREFFSLLGITIPPKPNLLPFSEVPVPCNTYTYMFPLFHDGALFGVAIGSFCIGFLHQYLYLNFKYAEEPILSYLYAISIYAIFMSVFEDAYFSSPGFWLMLLVPPSVYYLFRKIRTIQMA